MSDQPYVNLLDPEFYVDPWDAYRWLRDNEPVFWDPLQHLWGIWRLRSGRGLGLPAAGDHDRPAPWLRARRLGAGALLVGEHDVPGWPDRPARRPISSRRGHGEGRGRVRRAHVADHPRPARQP